MGASAQSDNHYSGKGTVMCESMMEPPHVPCENSCEGTLFCAPNFNDQQNFSFHADDGTNKVLLLLWKLPILQFGCKFIELIKFANRSCHQGKAMSCVKERYLSFWPQKMLHTANFLHIRPPVWCAGMPIVPGPLTPFGTECQNYL